MSMKRKVGSGKLVKTSVSIPQVLFDFAEKQRVEEGHNSFSAYVAHVVRLEKARVESLELARKIQDRYPAHREIVSRVEDSSSVSPSKPGTPDKSDSAEFSRHARKSDHPK